MCQYNVLPSQKIFSVEYLLPSIFTWEHFPCENYIFSSSIFFPYRYSFQLIFSSNVYFAATSSYNIIFPVITISLLSVACLWKSCQLWVHYYFNFSQRLFTLRKYYMFRSISYITVLFPLQCRSLMTILLPCSVYLYYFISAEVPLSIFTC